jgi:hypothetical protein
MVPQRSSARVKGSAALPCNRHLRARSAPFNLPFSALSGIRLNKLLSDRAENIHRPEREETRIASRWCSRDPLLDSSDCAGHRLNSIMHV